MVFQSKAVQRIFMFCGFLLMGIGFVFAEQGDFPFPWALVPVLATMLLISVLAGESNTNSLPRKFLASSIMTKIGKISYSLYLWHWPVAVLMKWTIGFEAWWHMVVYFVVSFLLACLSYFFIETPIRTSKLFSRQKNWKVIIACVAVLPVMFLVSHIISDTKDSISLSVTKDSSIWRSGWYYSDEPHPPVVAEPSLSGRTIFALGDSHTAAYRTMLHIVASHLGVETFNYEKGSCAIAGLLKPMSQLEGCEEYYKESLNEIKTKAKPGDIVFLASLRMPEIADSFEIVDISSIVEDFNGPQAVNDRQQALDDADRIFKEFEDLGLIVVISAPEPILKAPPFRCSDWFNKMNPIASPGLTVNRDFLLDLRKPVMQSLELLQKKHPDLRVWDPLLILCDNAEFSAYDKEGLPIFFDSDHFSAHGNRLLAPSFKETILSIWKN
jgi:hypothetical protein